MDKNNSPLQVNQSTLQDFIDCPRRFQLKVIDNTAWPAAYSAPIYKFENATLLGNQFHQICQQFFSGIDPQIIHKGITDPELVRMWSNFLPYGQVLLNKNYFTEIILSISLSTYKLIGKFDFLFKDSDNSYTIIDWKTSPKKPSRSVLEQRVQSYLYPYLFTEAGSNLFQTDKILPDAVTMHYWYPLCSDPDEILPYSSSDHQKICLKLTNILNRIDSYIENNAEFPCTDNQHNCDNCVFRSLCQRGEKASSLSPILDISQEDLSGTHFDLDIINEIDY